MLSGNSIIFRIMKVTKSKRNHPMAYASVKNGVLIIEDNINKYHIKNIDDWNTFINYIEMNEIIFENGFLCSSSIDFPKDSGASDELMKVIEEVFYK